MVAVKKALVTLAATAIGFGTIGVTANQAEAGHEPVLVLAAATAEVVGDTHQGIFVCNLDSTIATGLTVDIAGGVHVTTASSGCDAWITPQPIERFLLCVDGAGCTEWRYTGE